MIRIARAIGRYLPLPGRSGLRAAMAGFALGAFGVGTWALWDRHLVLSYEVVKLSDGSPESERIRFWLDGIPFVARRDFRIAAMGLHRVTLTNPQRRASREPALLEIASDDRWFAPGLPPPAGARGVPVKGGGHRLHCTVVAEVRRGHVTFQPAQGGPGPCVRARSSHGSD